MPLMAICVMPANIACLTCLTINGLSLSYFTEIEVPINVVMEAQSHNFKHCFWNYFGEMMQNIRLVTIEQVSDLLELMGLSFKDVMTEAFGTDCESSIDPVKRGESFLSDLCTKREDIYTGLDSRTGEPVEINEGLVKEYTRSVKLIVNAINRLIEAKDNQQQSRGRCL